ncbi:MAG: hypothetical protein ACOCY1_05625 [Halovenus sp.]
MISELLASLGLSGQLVSAGVILVALLRLRAIVGILSSIATVTWIGIAAVGVFVALLLALPGVDLVVHVQTLVDAIADVVTAVPETLVDVLREVGA